MDWYDEEADPVVLEVEIHFSVPLFASYSRAENEAQGFWRVSGAEPLVVHPVEPLHVVQRVA